MIYTYICTYCRPLIYQQNILGLNQLYHVMLDSQAIWIIVSQCNFLGRNIQSEEQPAMKFSLDLIIRLLWYLAPGPESPHI